ncbi:MAG: binary toxin-like calcium binding domain-containing protein [Planctomycetota bacterium]|jgi:hypothetical protein
MRTFGIAALLVLVACGGNGVEAVKRISAYRDLGALEDAIGDADPTDSDGDSIPDAIEAVLGSDPHNRDSDYDGLVDNYELFPAGFRRDDPLPDLDGDGLLASIDDDENDDRINDGMVVDTDGDGVPNFLEYYGYSYDFLTGEFVLWDGDPDTEHHFTDPLQPSTDQDAYPDGMEVSGIRLDPTVRAPGNDPLVAAYPNIVIEVASYSVTVNQTIQVSATESISEGRSWSRQTTRTHSHTSQFNWGIGVKAGFEAGADAKGANGKVTGEVSANIGGAYSNTHSTSVSRASGASVTSSQGWSEARSSNPTDAAHIKLFLKVHNRGTGPVSNMLPTLTLKIGGLSVATFEPGNAEVNMLVPGGTYPAEPGVFWVVDSALKGGSATPLSLTLNELRALERGAPLSVSLTQVEGDSMRLSSDAIWESGGDVTEYIARCDAVCANLRIDLGDGELVHHLVYAAEGPSAPRMTLGDALARMGVDPEGVLTYVDSSGNPRMRSLEGFRYAVDTNTLRRNGWELVVDGAAEDKPPEGFSIASMAIFARSNVVIRAPRDPGVDPEPELHYAYLDPFNGEIAISASDYEGIDRVVVESEDGLRTMELGEDVPGAGFYSGVANEESGFESDEELFVVVTNLAGDSIERRRLGKLFQEADPAKPIIEEVTLNLDRSVLYVNAKSGNAEDPRAQIAWVRVYHEDLKVGSEPAFRELKPVIDFFRDPDGWTVELPAGFDPKTDVEVVAYVSPGIWSNEYITPDEAISSKVLYQSAVTMKTKYYNAFTDTFGWSTLRLDAPPGERIYRYHAISGVAFTAAQVQPDPGPPVDMTLRLDFAVATINSTAEMLFNASHHDLGANLKLYTDTTKAQLEQVNEYTDESPLAVGADPGLQRNHAYAIITTESHYAKIYIDWIQHDKVFHTLDNTVEWRVRIRFTVYEK